MDMVRGFQSAFNSIKDNPIKDITVLKEALKNYSEKKEDPTSWRWDVMRSVVSDDLDYVKLVTIGELEAYYNKSKETVSEHPYILDIIVMTLQAHYDKFKSLVDVVAVQQKVFGPELFSVIEEKTIVHINKMYPSLLTSYVRDGMTPLEYAKWMYKSYENEYKDYYFWPHMKVAMDKVITNLS